MMFCIFIDKGASYDIWVVINTLEIVDEQDLLGDNGAGRGRCECVSNI